MWGIENIYVIGLIGILSIVILVWSAEQVVHKMIKIAHHFGLSDTFVGLTVLSIGTSLPEISSHIIASLGILNGSLDFEIASSTVLGANIGSNIVQQTLIVGLVIILVGTMTFDRRFLAQNYVAMLVTMGVVRFLGLDGLYSQTDSAVLLLLFAMYLYFLYAQEQADKTNNKNTITHEKLQHPRLEFAGLVGGMGLLLFASTVSLEVVQIVVLNTNVSGSLIGVVSLGIASALPEMITAISGIKQKAKGISLGTLIGSNIVNPLVAIGLGGVISSYYVPGPLKYRDLPMQIATAVLLLIWLLTHQGKISKKGGIFLICIYVTYLLVRMKYFNID